MKKIIILSLMLVGLLNQANADELFQAHDKDHTLYRVPDNLVSVRVNYNFVLSTIYIQYPSNNLSRFYYFWNQDTCKSDFEELTQIAKRIHYKRCIKFEGGSACKGELN